VFLGPGVLIMKFVFLLLVITGAAFIGYPLLNEDASSECSALERRLITITQQAENRALLGVLQSSLSNGSVVAAAAKQNYPNLPTALTCAVTYWQTCSTASNYYRGVTKRSTMRSRHLLRRVKPKRRCGHWRIRVGPAAPTRWSLNLSTVPPTARPRNGSWIG
jgi:hypothetical protein